MVVSFAYLFAIVVALTIIMGKGMGGKVNVESHSRTSVPPVNRSCDTAQCACAINFVAFIMGKRYFSHIT